MAINNEALDKTSSRLLVETDALLQGAIDKSSDARNAGSGRSRGFASLIVLAAGLLVQSGGILALDKLTPPMQAAVKSDTQKKGLALSEERLVRSNLERIKLSTGEILRVRDRVAPAMQIDANISAINSSVADLETVLLPVEERKEERPGAP